MNNLDKQFLLRTSGYQHEHKIDQDIDIHLYNFSPVMFPKPSHYPSHSSSVYVSERDWSERHRDRNLVANDVPVLQAKVPY